MDTEKQLQQIIDLLKNINDSLEKLSRSPQYFINVEQADVHNPILEKMDFNMESLDIDEVSGALNLGNNFGVEVKKKEEGKKQESKKDISKMVKQKKEKAKKEVKKILGELKNPRNESSEGPSTEINSKNLSE